MKAVILAGGLGTRLAEETEVKPKPMVEIGGKPILWHIMKIYSSYGINDFVVCTGYKGYVIKEYFSNYFLHMSDVTFDLETNSMEVHSNTSESWKVTLVDTGEETSTGGRLLRVKPYLEGEKNFCFTYGDGVGNIDISKLVDYHRAHGKTATLTATHPPGRFGALDINPNQEVEQFIEKPEGDGNWINGGFFVLNIDAIDFVRGDDTSWESDVLPILASHGQLKAFKHEGFWQPMDTLREKKYLEELWESKSAPWKVW